MIELRPHQLTAHTSWLCAAEPGPAALAEHVLTTGNGHGWADRAVQPRTIAVDCARHVLLRGDPGALDPAGLAPLAHRYIEAPGRFLPLLGASFDRVVPWERMVYVQRERATAPRPPRGVTIRPLTSADAPTLVRLAPDTAWIHASWGGPSGLGRSGHAWGAFRQGALLAVACTYFRGGTYEDIAVVTAPDQRRWQLALGCVVALSRDIAARGRAASWTCSRYNRASRVLAWTAGFRLVREYVHYATGSPAVRVARIPA